MLDNGLLKEIVLEQDKQKESFNTGIKRDILDGLTNFRCFGLFQAETDKGNISL